MPWPKTDETHYHAQLGQSSPEVLIGSCKNDYNCDKKNLHAFLYLINTRYRRQNLKERIGGWGKINYPSIPDFFTHTDTQGHEKLCPKLLSTMIIIFVSGFSRIGK